MEIDFDGHGLLLKKMLPVDNPEDEQGNSAQPNTTYAVTR